MGEGMARVGPGSPIKAGEKARFAISTDGPQFSDPQNETAIWH